MKPRTWSTLIEKEKDYHVNLHGYCDNNDADGGACPAREVTVLVKDFHRDLPRLLKKGPFCPLCGARLLTGWYVPPIERVVATHKRQRRQASRDVFDPRDVSILGGDPSL